MEAIRTIWSFVLLFGLLAFAQLLGVLLFSRVKRYQHFFAHFSGFLIPILLSIGFCWMIFVYRYYHLHPDDRDGGQLLGALGIIALAVGVQTIVGLIAQLVLHSRNTTCGSH
jgi:uncharacterized BrkB/YihY/UPF0761 family membrane protein